MSAVKTEEDWLAVLALDEIPMLGARVLEGAAIGPVAVFRTEDQSVFALRDRCPHKGGPLSQGIVHGHRVTCPLHGWNIELEGGEAVAPDTGCAGRLSVRIEGSQVYLNKAELAGVV
ncbi:MAG: nitrite reductase small subunit NirD [Ferrovum sp.]|nr:nitrite reductase small subunit NirD [Ferrovum sp.]